MTPKVEGVGSRCRRAQVRGVGRGRKPQVRSVGGVWLAGEEFGDERERALGGGESNAVGTEMGDGVETLKGKCEMCSAFVAGESVNFIDDDGFNMAQDFAAAGGGEQDVERLRGGDKDVRREL